MYCKGNVVLCGKCSGGQKLGSCLKRLRTTVLSLLVCVEIEETKKEMGPLSTMQFLLLVGRPPGQKWGERKTTFFLSVARWLF